MMTITTTTDSRNTQPQSSPCSSQITNTKKAPTASSASQNAGQGTESPWAGSQRRVNHWPGFL